jgi:hypothetical protein
MGQIQGMTGASELRVDTRNSFAEAKTMSIKKLRRRDSASTSRRIIDSVKRPHDAKDHSDFIPYPTNKVVGIIDDVGDAQAALRDLKAAGFTAKQVRVLTGKEGAHRLDVKGDEHGPLAHIVRSTQRLLGDYEIEHATRHEQELLAGHFGIGVTAQYKENRDKARQILKAHHGHFINFYGRWAMENLDR